MADNETGSQLNEPVVPEPSPVILVVEDDSAVRQPLVKFLQMRQYTVVTAETADEGLDAIKTHRPAAAIIDLRLRRGSGREVVVSVPPDIPVIIFSGLRSESADLETIRPQHAPGRKAVLAGDADGHARRHARAVARQLEAASAAWPRLSADSRQADRLS